MFYAYVTATERATAATLRLTCSNATLNLKPACCPAAGNIGLNVQWQPFTFYTPTILLCKLRCIVVSLRGLWPWLTSMAAYIEADGCSRVRTHSLSYLRLATLLAIAAILLRC